MLNFLDVRTVVFILAIGNALFAVLFYFATRKSNLIYDFLFMFSMAAQSCAWICIFFRDIISNIILFNLGNTLLFIGFACEGLCLLSLETEITRGKRAFFLSLTILVLVMWWYPGFDDIFKIFSFSILFNPLFSMPAIYMIFLAPRPSSLQQFTGVAVLLCAFVMTVRGIYIYASLDYELCSHVFVQLASMLALFLLMLVASTGYILIRREFAYNDLNRLASIDDLTEVHNRRTFLDYGLREFQRSRRYNHSMAFMMMDVDHFKDVNDNHGHHGGDKVLKALACRSKEVLRTTDLFGRLGGEEFGCILPEVSAEQAVAAAERLRGELAAMKVHTNRDIIQVTVSIGLTMLTAEDETLEDIMNRADSALYKAKESGRNSIVRA